MCVQPFCSAKPAIIGQLVKCSLRDIKTNRVESRIESNRWIYGQVEEIGVARRRGGDNPLFSGKPCLPRKRGMQRHLERKRLFTWNLHRSPMQSFCTPQMCEYDRMLRH